MKISKAGLNIIKGFEGYARKLQDGTCTTYYCSAGVLTIGYGSTTGFKKGDIWTHDQAIEALKRDCARFEKAVNEMVTVELNQNQFDAMMSFVYNIGEGNPKETDPKKQRGFYWSGVRRALNKGDFEGAVRCLNLYVNAAGKRDAGLVRRRREETVLFERPVEFDPEAMPQAVDPPAALPEAPPEAERVPQAPTPQQEPAPTSEAPASVVARMSESLPFSKLNELAEEGSRLAGHIRSFIRWWWLLITGGTVVTATVNPNRGSANVVARFICDHPFAAVGITFGVTMLLVYIGLWIMRHYLVTAAKAGRYRPEQKVPAT